MPFDFNNIEEAEAFQRAFVKPLVDAVREEVKPIVEHAADHEKRLSNLEGNQKKALAGLAVYATILSTGIGLAGNWIRSKVHL